MISLRDITLNDQDRIREWRNNPEVRKYMYTDHEISPAEHRAWFRRVLQDPTCKYWIIVSDGEDVGLLYLYDIDTRNRRCYWGFYTAAQSGRGKGIGSFAEFSVLRIVFEDLQLQKLCGEVLATNQAVLNMHKKFGFAQEGLFRKHIFKSGSFADVVCIGMQREEWEANKPNIEIKLRSKGIVS